jgi:DnaA family protein
MKQIALALSQSPEASLDNFEAGVNLSLIEHLKLFAKHPQRSPVPTYLWGPSGTGKTHLLLAVAKELRQLGQVYGWLSAKGHEQSGEATHVSALTSPLSGGAKTSDPQVFDPAWDVILMDDVDQFNLSQQQFAFNCFVNALTPAAGLQRWVLATGSLPPKDLKLREDLRTRLGWGHVFELHPLSEQGVRSVLQWHASALGLDLSAELQEYIFSHFSRDLSSLVQLLIQLDAYALQTKRHITIPLLKAMLDEI